jgi:16S rRNA (guanine527-N7)-methyltransferase
VGSGAGLPGIPLKIVEPALELTLIEARLKKALFLKEIVRKLSLENVEVRNERAEDVESVYPVVVTRALGGLEKAGRICLPLITSDGMLIIFRGAERDEEPEMAVAAMEKYGGRVLEEREIVSPVTGERARLLFVSNVSRET